MGDFISGMIKLILKMIVLLVVVYVGFVVISMILDDIDRRFLSDDEVETEKTEKVVEGKTEEVEVVKSKSESVQTTQKSTTKKEKKDPVVMFDEPRDCVSSRNFKVKEIIASKYVIAEELHPDLEEYGFTTDLAVVFIDIDNMYYTDQVIHVSRGKCVRQIGVYKSTHYLYDDKTLPIVRIMDK